jgi:hypothetical protein
LVLGWSFISDLGLSWTYSKNFNLTSWWYENSYFIRDYSINFYVCSPILLCTGYISLSSVLMFSFEDDISCCSNNPFVSLFHMFLFIHPFSALVTTYLLAVMAYIVRVDPHPLVFISVVSIIYFVLSITALVCGSSLMTFL